MPHAPGLVIARHAHLLDAHVPWIVCRPDGRAAITTNPLGVEITHVIDPLRMDAAPLLQRLRTLDVQAYGHRAMPNWVFYDCTVVPGALFGLARLGPDGLDPVSLLGVIPMAHRRAELVTTLSAPPELMPLTLALGAAALGIDQMMVVTQWGSRELTACARFGPLRLHTTWTPAHDDPRTVTFSVATGPAARERMLTSDRSPVWPDTSEDALREMQAAIERGERVEL